MSEIVIFGAGISGLITAISLAQKGIKTTIIDKNHTFDHAQKDLRNIALTYNSKRFFELNNIWSKLENLVAPVLDIYTIDNKHPQMLHFGERDTVFDALGYMIPYKHLHTALLDYAREINLIYVITGKKYTNIEFSENTLENRHAKIHLDDESNIQADLIIACDGKNSSIKHKYFGKFISRDYKETALVFNISHDVPHNGTAIEHFTYNGVFAVLPLKAQNESAIVWSLKDDVAAIYLDMPVDKLKEHVLNALGESYGDINIISEIVGHKLYAEVVEQYFYKNIVLVSDSAHTIHPLAGQGLNQGIKDIESLVNIIYDRLSLGLDIDKIALEEYQKSRRLGNLAMFAAMDLFDKVFVNNYPIISSIRPHLLGVADKLSFLKKWCL